MGFLTDQDLGGESGESLWESRELGLEDHSLPCLPQNEMRCIATYSNLESTSREW